LTEEAVGGVARWMDVGMTEVQIQDEVTTGAMDMKYVVVESECDGSGVTSQEVKEGRVGKKSVSGKHAKDMNNLDNLTEIELKRLKVEEKRLDIEARRL